MSVTGDSDATRLPRSPSDSLEHVGPYHLLEKLGEGGMGEVWVAEQREPIRRTVALKIIKVGMDTRQVVARFEAERQALAVMDHPAIAKVLDAGATGHGRPYFVMEYVKGEPITTYCDREALSTADRLALFVRVCEGVQHAHQKGIIHRDLKPSNVLVTIQDGQPVPKIIDFGIAKATAHRLTEQTIFTELGILVGTPEYMSPEQAEMSGLDIDTRTDIYSLGVLLYELLTGTLPFDAKTLREKGLDEIRRTIRECDPPRPSTRVTRLGPASTEAARKRLTEPARLASQLRGDLDWITMKALEKNRTRRYDTAMGLANDVRRHVMNEPVSAGPPSATYRAKKFVRRHRFGVGAAAALVLLLLAFGVTMAVQAERIARERDRANREAGRANEEAEAARQVSDFLVGLFQLSDPNEARANSVTAREILDKGAARIEQELAGQAAVQSRLMNTMGTVYYRLGLYREAVALHRRSLDVRRRAFGNDAVVAASLQDLGSSLVRLGDLAGADAALNEALVRQEALFGKNSAEVAATLSALGELAYVRGDYPAAEALFRRDLGTLRRLPTGREEAIGDALNNLAMAVQQTRADYRGALTLLQESLEVRRRLFGAVHPQIAQSLNNLAMAHYRLKEYQEAEPLFGEALAMNRRLFGDVHPDVAANLGNLGLVARDRGDYAAANALLEETIAMDRRLLGGEHIQVARDLNNLAESLRLSGDAKRAEAVLRESLAIHATALAAGHWQTAATKIMLARCLAQERKFVEAERLLLEGYPVVERQFGPSSPRVTAAVERAVTLYETWGKPDKAAEWRKKLPPK